jgi:hypothetical protein
MERKVVTEIKPRSGLRRIPWMHLKRALAQGHHDQMMDKSDSIVPRVDVALLKRNTEAHITPRV